MHAYIPRDVWYQFPSGVKVEDVGVYTDLDAPPEKINVHVRGGFIIPMQIPGINLMAGRGNPFTLLVAQSSLKMLPGISFGMMVILLVSEFLLALLITLLLCYRR